MTPPPLCIIQARLGSTRLPNKILLTLGAMSLIEIAWRTACKAFGEANVVIAHPDTPENQPLVSHIDAMLARRFGYQGAEHDVLGRFHACAHSYRWHPDSVIVRYTPDDPFKTVEGLRRVANGERLPVEIGGEAFTLAQLDAAHEKYRDSSREHLTYAFFGFGPVPQPPAGQVWTIDTTQDLEAARAIVEGERRLKETLDDARRVAESAERMADTIRGCRAMWDLERGAVG